MSELFRREAIETQGTPKTGQIVLASTLPMWLMTTFAGAVLFAVSISLVCLSYTKRESVPGVIVTHEESVRVEAPTSGVLIHTSVNEGSIVHKGDPLFTFGSDKKNAQGESPIVGIESTIRSKISSLTEDLARATALSSAEMSSAQQSVSELKEQLRILEVQSGALLSRQKSAESQADIHEKLAQQGFESTLMAQQKIDDLSELKIRVSENQRQLAVVRSAIEDKTNAIGQIRLRELSAEAQIQRQLLDENSNLISQGTAKEWSVTSPIDGILTNINIAAGQVTTAGLPLAEILPLNTKLQANIYASSREIGFAKVGQKVKMRVDSYPYMKFGTVDGVIDSISATPARLGDITNLAAKLAVNPSFTGAPIYPIHVSLNNQYVDGSHAKLALRSGMQVDAQVQLETKSLLEWLLEPLQAGSK